MFSAQLSCVFKLLYCVICVIFGCSSSQVPSDVSSHESCSSVNTVGVIVMNVISNNKIAIICLFLLILIHL